MCHFSGGSRRISLSWITKHLPPAKKHNISSVDASNTSPVDHATPRFTRLQQTKQNLSTVNQSSAISCPLCHRLFPVLFVTYCLLSSCHKTSPVLSVTVCLMSFLSQTVSYTPYHRLSPVLFATDCLLSPLSQIVSCPSL